MLAISISVFFLGCQLPVAPAPGPNNGLKTGDLLASIPVVSAKLPRSLQDGTAPEPSGSSRALGDVTTLDPDNIGGVRADGYIELKRQLKNNIVSVVLSLLKAAVAGKDIPLNEDYTIGVRDLPPELLPGPNGATTMDLGVIRLAKPAADTLEAKWAMQIVYEARSGDTTYTQTQDMRFFLRIVGTDPATVKTSLAADMVVTGGPNPSMHLELASGYDAVTGELTQVQRMGSYNTLTVLKNQNGFVQYYSLSPDNAYVAYANDDMGGVVNTRSHGGYSGISTEYYDGQGDLVLQQWGNGNEPEVGWLPSDAFNLTSLSGVSSAPSSISIKRASEWRYHSDGSFTDNSTYSYSLDGEDYEPFENNSDGWAYIWKAGDDWAPGDSVYYQGSGDWSNYSGGYDEATEDWVYTNTSTVSYQIGYTVPTPELYLGDNYYMQNSFPLKALRLNDDLASKYALKMKERHTSYSWDDAEGNSHYESDENGVPDGWTEADPYDRWSWTDYDFWMENLATSGDPDRQKDSLGFPMANPGMGDLIPTNIYNQEYWAWDPELQASVTTKAVTVNTSLSVPVGFAFEHQSLVTSVKDQLENLYESIGAEAIDATTLKTKADAIIVMPDLETFPVLPTP